jgi:hypothetical protein
MRSPRAFSRSGGFTVRRAAAYIDQGRSFFDFRAVDQDSILDRDRQLFYKLFAPYHSRRVALPTLVDALFHESSINHNQTLVCS